MVSNTGRRFLENKDSDDDDHEKDNDDDDDDDNNYSDNINNSNNNKDYDDDDDTVKIFPRITTACNNDDGDITGWVIWGCLSCLWLPLINAVK